MQREERHGRQAEISVLGGMLIGGPEAVDRTAPLEPPDFFYRGDQLLFEAIWHVRSHGESVEAVTVYEELVARGHSERIGGMEYLAELQEAAVTAVDIESSVRIVQAASEDRRRQRRIDALRRDLEEGVQDLGEGKDPHSAIAELQQSLAAFREEYEPDGFPPPRTAHEILEEPEQPEEWIAHGLVPAGGNVLVAGYPKSFKTFWVLELAVAAATATPFLGKYPVERAHRVGVVLMEGKERAQAYRVARLCAARGIDPEDVGQLFLWHRPPLRFTDSQVMASLAAQVERLDLELLVVDAWSYVSSGDSDDADQVTPQLMAYSGLRKRRSGLTTALVHHARKDPGDRNANRLTDLIRNSGAFGAWYDAGFVLGRKDEQSPVSVRAELRDSPAPEAFAFTVEDQEPARPGNEWTPQGWIRLTASDVSPQTLEREAEARQLLRPLVEYLHEHNGCSKNQLRKGVPADNRTIDAALEILQASGDVEIEDRGPGKKHPIWLRNGTSLDLAATSLQRRPKEYLAGGPIEAPPAARSRSEVSAVEERSEVSGQEEMPV